MVLGCPAMATLHSCSYTVSDSAVLRTGPAHAQPIPVATKPAFRSARALLAALVLLPAALSGCETNDPCALRQAACVDVGLMGQRDDGAGNPIAYRDLTVKVCAPDSFTTTGDPQAKCNRDAPCGTELASTPMPLMLQAVGSYSANVQGLVSFKLPDSFNDLADIQPGMQLEDLRDNASKIARLKELRKTDPRAVRILVLQAGNNTPVWDSRCEEDLFSADQWLMLKYYRIGKNEYRAVYADLKAAKTSTP